MNKLYTALLCLLLSSCGTNYFYMTADKNNDSIDCDKLINNFSHLHYISIFEREKFTGYSFKQCREEIKEDHYKKCLNIITSNNKINDRTKLSCKIQAKDYLASLNDEFQIKGKALIIKGTAFNNNGLIVGAIDKSRIFGEHEYYRIRISSGETYRTLKFGDKNLADKAHDTLVDFISR